MSSYGLLEVPGLRASVDDGKGCSKGYVVDSVGVCVSLTPNQKAHPFAGLVAVSHWARFSVLVRRTFTESSTCSCDERGCVS